MLLGFLSKTLGLFGQVLLITLYSRSLLFTDNVSRVGVTVKHESQMLKHRKKG